MEKKIVELKCKTLLVDVSGYPLNFLIFPHRLTANAYIGCLHECVYCYAKWYCKKDEIRVKVNAPEILRKELQNRINKGKPREPVCFGSISDPYHRSQCLLRRRSITEPKHTILSGGSWDLGRSFKGQITRRLAVLTGSRHNLRNGRRNG